MTTLTCPACDANTTNHCGTNLDGTLVSRTCDMWRCTRCYSYGTDKKFVRDDRKRGPQ